MEEKNRAAKSHRPAVVCLFPNWQEGAA